MGEGCENRMGGYNDKFFGGIGWKLVNGLFGLDIYCYIVLYLFVIIIKMGYIIVYRLLIVFKCWLYLLLLDLCSCFFGEKCILNFFDNIVIWYYVFRLLLW